VRIVAVLGDRASNEYRGRQHLVDDGTVAFNLPCGAHGLHNMVNDIIKSYPLFTSLLEEAVAFVKDIMTKKPVRSVHSEYLAEANVRKLTI
jgi:hypothetical protein